VSKKILAVDDEGHILHVVSMKLRNAGYEVITAMDGEEALQLCASEQPDLLVTDLQMPVMTGLELCARLRQEGNDRMPIIMLTARGFDLEQDEMVRAGISTVLAKPFSPRELLAKVEKLLAGVSKVESGEQA
jgi:two-component system alkaline phosphatase synthesis response regulator PhoP